MSRLMGRAGAIGTVHQMASFTPLRLPGLGTGPHRPNMASDGQRSQSTATSTATFTPRAASVLNIGHVPKKSTMPATETSADATARGRQTLAGTTTPQNDIAAMTNPTSDTIQNALASVVAVSAGSDGTSQDRAASQSPVFVPGAEPDPGQGSERSAVAEPVQRAARRLR